MDAKRKKDGSIGLFNLGCHVWMRLKDTEAK